MAYYPTLKSLQEARQAGKVPAAATIVLDDDDTFVYVGTGNVFSMHPAQLLEEALDLLGIPHENC